EGIHLRHLGLTRGLAVQLAKNRPITGMLDRREPGAEEVRAQRDHHFGFIELIGRDDSRSVAILLRLKDLFERGRAEFNQASGSAAEARKEFLDQLALG